MTQVYSNPYTQTTKIEIYNLLKKQAVLENVQLLVVDGVVASELVAEDGVVCTVDDRDPDPTATTEDRTTSPGWTTTV